jgi:hypothetical protein
MSCLRGPAKPELPGKGAPENDCFAMVKEQSAELVLGRVLVVRS